MADPPAPSCHRFRRAPAAAASEDGARVSRVDDGDGPVDGAAGRVAPHREAGLACGVAERPAEGERPVELAREDERRGVEDAELVRDDGRDSRGDERRGDPSRQVAAAPPRAQAGVEDDEREPASREERPEDRRFDRGDASRGRLEEERARPPVGVPGPVPDEVEDVARPVGDEPVERLDGHGPLDADPREPLVDERREARANRLGLRLPRERREARRLRGGDEDARAASSAAAPPRTGSPSRRSA